MGAIGRLKEGAEQATRGARESVQEAQLRRDLSQAHAELGRATFALIEEGALTDERLASTGGRVRELESRLAATTTAGADAKRLHPANDRTDPCSRDPEEATP